MQTGDFFDHPNQTFVFSPSGVWAATLTGTSFTADELRTARDRAMRGDRWLLRPEAWIVIACIGLAMSMMVVLRSRDR
jgi:hypothetical protein